jgi:hypothetical protein
MRPAASIWDVVGASASVFRINWRPNSLNYTSSEAPATLRQITAIPNGNNGDFPEATNRRK